MTTKTKKPKAPVKDWNVEMEKWPVEKDEEKPEEPRPWHYSCDRCYPPEYHGPAVFLCGGNGTHHGDKAPTAKRKPANAPRCGPCALIAHRRPLAPCPNKDCPRRVTFWKILFG